MTTIDYTALPAPQTGDELYRRTQLVASQQGKLASLGLYCMHDWTPVAFYPKSSEDGQDALIEAMAWPAQFYRLTIPDSESGISIHTGSGKEIGDLLIRMAKEVASDMLCLRVEARLERARGE